MDNTEINSMFDTANLFAERSYFELFNCQPDTSNEDTRKLLDALIQSWLTGYAYLRVDQRLDNAIEEKFGFFVDSY